MNDFTFSVEDLKQYTYCPRIPYFRYVVPVPKNPTYKMQHGKTAEKGIEALEHRRTLRRYGLEQARRHAHPHLFSAAMRLSGVPDVVLETDDSLFVVDYKFTEGPINENIMIQAAAYCIMAEEKFGKKAPAFFIYRIPGDQVDAFDMTSALRGKVLEALQAINRIVENEAIPLHKQERAKCVDCEYQNYCGDVF